MLGGLLLMRPTSGAGATPMLPKNGFSGMTMPGRKVAVMFLRSSRMMVCGRPGSQFSRTKPLQPL